MSNKRTRFEFKTKHLLEILASLATLLFLVNSLFLPSALNRGHMGIYNKESGAFSVVRMTIKISRKAILEYEGGEKKEVAFHNKIDGDNELIYFHMSEYSEPVKFVFSKTGEMVNAKESTIVFRKA